MKLILIFFLGGLLMNASTGYSESYPAPELYGTDALGRMMPERSEVREFQKDRYVGIFYFLWLRMNTVYDNSEILRKNPLAKQTNASPPWGPRHTFHFWGEPLYGYYRSEDPWVLRRHAILLSDAGVDFLMFDATNAIIYTEQFMALCEVFDQQRLQGEHVPQIAFMLNTKAGETANKVYETLYKPGLYPELWFRWQGKPLLLCDPEEASEEVKEFFTLRKAHWPFDLVDTHNEWHWEATYPQVYSYDEDPTQAEQVNVSVGQNLHQETGNVEMISSGHARGRSFHDGRMDNRPQSYKYGFNFQEQWQRAFELDPEVAFITGWNEWVAMQLHDKPPVIFCDQYNLEFSRDAEMMKGGYGDNYYLQMAQNIRRFKGTEAPQPLSAPKTIDVTGDFSQWDDVTPEYRAHVLETLPRDHPGCGDNHYTVDTGRNDFHLLKMTQDSENLYFYAQTREAISPYTDQNWMWLFIDVRGTGMPEWEGFNYRVNGDPSSSTRTSVEICAGGWDWKPVGETSCRVQGNQMHIAIPKAMLGISGDQFVVEFKWIDNCQSPGDIMDVYINGDTAPSSRFRYRFDSN